MRTGLVWIRRAVGPKRVAGAEPIVDRLGRKRIAITAEGVAGGVGSYGLALSLPR
jgi:hypothetical protein